MAIKRGSKADSSYGAASMTDLMFLLLIFLMVATTLINTNALKVNLPKSSSKVSEAPRTTISVTSDLKYYVDKQKMPFDEVEVYLQMKLKGEVKPVIMLNMDKSVTVDELTKIMNIAIGNKYLLHIRTQK